MEDRQISLQAIIAMAPEVQKILRNGNTVEIKRRKDDLIVLEVDRKIKYKISPNGAK